ncbi:MAG TPA: FmdB family zinc ribbon protein [Candidatus Limnocylindrales bacterium]|nr:FmdB family zinc ribbon protein [Candidatus Limnocylindrales bacterium]
MPLYDYDCAACGRRFELIHGVHAEPPTTCPLCGSGPIRKAIAAPAIHYKGSGWAKKERRAAVTSGTSSKRGDDQAADATTTPAEPGATSERPTSERPAAAEPAPAKAPATPAD